MSDDEAPAARKRGRPAGKRGTFTFRVTAELRAKLEAAAAAAERPVSEEIEARLERSFDAELNALRRAMFGDPQTEVLLRQLVWAARLIEDRHANVQGKPPAPWHSDEEMRAAMRKAAQKIVVAATPHGPGRDRFQDMVDGKLGEPDPIEEAQQYGLGLGMVITGDTSALEVQNLGFRSEDF